MGTTHKGQFTPHLHLGNHTYCGKDQIECQEMRYSEKRLADPSDSGLPVGPECWSE